MRVSVCVYLCVNRGWTVLIELVSDDSGESHKKKEGMPKGSTGISFPLMSLSLSLSLALFPPTIFFWISTLLFLFTVFYMSPRNTEVSLKDLPSQLARAILSIDCPTQAICY